MQYHISTGLIIEHFENQCNCPLCKIEKIVEENIARELLQDGCMDDDVRRQVNEKGFCEKHFDLLYSMPSKLGLSLQMTTRTKTLLSKLSKPYNIIKAKNQSKLINNQLQTCIVCDFTENEMIKYYKTIAQLYSNEGDFRKMFENSNGFCLKHYGKLLAYSEYAVFSSKKYLDSLYKVQLKRMDKSVDLLNTFSNRHDYRNLGKPLGEATKALPNIKSDYFGEK